jgi:hypothetical protein
MRGDGIHLQFNRQKQFIDDPMPITHQIRYANVQSSAVLEKQRANNTFATTELETLERCPGSQELKQGC